jgi:hypothetical protein
LRGIFARSTTLLALTSIAPSVSALTVATVTTTSTAKRPSLALALAKHAPGRSMRLLLLNVRGGDNLGGKVKPLAEIVETLGGQGVVVPLPRELSLDIAARVERLKSLDDKEVLGVDLGVLGEVEVLRGHEHTLAEEVLDFGVSYLFNSERHRHYRIFGAFVVFTSWIFFRSALGINIVVVFFVSRYRGSSGRFAGRTTSKVPVLELEFSVGSEPYVKL